MSRGQLRLHCCSLRFRPQAMAQHNEPCHFPCKHSIQPYPVDRRSGLVHHRLHLLFSIWEPGAVQLGSAISLRLLRTTLFSSLVNLNSTLDASRRLFRAASRELTRSRNPRTKKQKTKKEKKKEAKGLMLFVLNIYQSSCMRT